MKRPWISKRTPKFIDKKNKIYRRCFRRKMLPKRGTLK